MQLLDGNAAVAQACYAFSQVLTVYPITPSTSMSELSEVWSAQEEYNIWDTVVDVQMMQSEAGAVGAMHGSLSSRALSATFTASQGLLLMLPTVYRMVGERLPAVFHVASRSVATHSLSIYNDHSDVMAVRQSGAIILASANVQEAYVHAILAHLLAIKNSVPVIHFFDGFRTSHEMQKIETLNLAQLKEIFKTIEPEYNAFLNSAMLPEQPYVKSAAQSPEFFFQAQERSNQDYNLVLAQLNTLRDVIFPCFSLLNLKDEVNSNGAFSYYGHHKARAIIVIMGSATYAAQSACAYLNQHGETACAVIQVRLYRPFEQDAFLACLPSSVETVSVLDRTKEAGATSEPLCLDVMASIMHGGFVNEDGSTPQVLGGRYGLGGKEFTPKHALAVFANAIKSQPKRKFTVGIADDVTHLSLPEIRVKDGESLFAENENHGQNTETGVFSNSTIVWGFGSDGSVSGTKSTLKLLAKNDAQHVQGYFLYDSKKAGGLTRIFIRLSDSHQEKPWLITQADIGVCMNPEYLEIYNLVKHLKAGGSFLVNTSLDAQAFLNKLTREQQNILRDKKICIYTIDAFKLARELGMKRRIGTIMQAAYFKLLVADETERTQYKEKLKEIASETYRLKGRKWIEKNHHAIEQAFAAVQVLTLPEGWHELLPPSPAKQNIPSRMTLPLATQSATSFDQNFVENVFLPSYRGEGDSVAVSQIPSRGHIPLGTTKLEKRNIATHVPRWHPNNCVQCNKCVMACPHAVIRAKQIDPQTMTDSPKGFVTLASTTKNDRNLQYRLQVSVEDCTGCGVCIDVCPVTPKALSFTPLAEEKDKGAIAHYEYFETFPYGVNEGAYKDSVRGSQLQQPLIEFSGACPGCGETPYLKLLTQLFGENMVVANATGCSSIFGGTFPSVPYTVNQKGRGVAWGNSLFENNGEYGLGMRLGIDNKRKYLKQKIKTHLKQTSTERTSLFYDINKGLEHCLQLWNAKTLDQQEEAVLAQESAQLLLDQLASTNQLTVLLQEIKQLSNYLSEKSVWSIGGDGWAYDIGSGGLEHLFNGNKNVNVLVLDTEGYANTGGQQSQSTPLAAVANLSSRGKAQQKKEFGLATILQNNVYVASISLGANFQQSIQAMIEAENHDGPSLILAYAPCIIHGIDMMQSNSEMKRAVEAGYWPLYRFNPNLATGSRFQWDYKNPTVAQYKDFLNTEQRYVALKQQAPELFHQYQEQALQKAQWRNQIYSLLEKM